MGRMREVDDEHWYDVPRRWDPEGTAKPWPSITTIGSIVAAPELQPWYAKVAARRMADDLERMAGLIAAGRIDEAVRMAAGEPTRIRDEAGDLGKLIHKVIEWEVRGQAYTLTPDERKLAAPYLDTIRRFVEEMGLHPIAAESTVYHQFSRYAGTLDLFGSASVPLPILTRAGELLRTVEPGEPGVWDWKTGTGSAIEKKGPQVVGYCSATHWDIKDGKEELRRMPRADWGALVHLAPPIYRVYPVQVTPAAQRAFRLARELFEAVREDPPKIIGMPTRAGTVHLDDLTFVDRRARAELTIGGLATLDDVAELGLAGFLSVKHAGPAAAEKVGRLLAATGLQWAEPRSGIEERVVA